MNRNVLRYQKWFRFSSTGHRDLTLFKSNGIFYWTMINAGKIFLDRGFHDPSIIYPWYWGFSSIHCPDENKPGFMVKLTNNYKVHDHERQTKIMGSNSTESHKALSIHCVCVCTINVCVLCWYSNLYSYFAVSLLFLMNWFYNFSYHAWQ